MVYSSVQDMIKDLGDVELKETKIIINDPDRFKSELAQDEYLTYWYTPPSVYTLIVPEEGVSAGIVVDTTTEVSLSAVREVLRES